MWTLHAADGFRQIEEYLAKYIPEHIAIRITTEYKPPVSRGGPKPPTYKVELTVNPGMIEPGIASRFTITCAGGDMDKIILAIVANYRQIVSDNTFVKHQPLPNLDNREAQQ